MNKELLRKVKEYIEKNEMRLDSEVGSCREVDQLVADGDMPKIYFEVCEELMNPKVQVPIIENPLEWQAARKDRWMGNASYKLFWDTVDSMGFDVIYLNGAPEFTRIFLRLNDTHGLCIGSDDETSSFIFGLVDLTEQNEEDWCDCEPTIQPFSSLLDLIKKSGLSLVHYEGMSEISSLVFKLNDQIGLRLWTELEDPFVNPSFVPLHPYTT